MTASRRARAREDAPPVVDASGSALFLDFDGTLVEFADSPSAVEVDAYLLDLLCRLRGAFGGAVALVGGRPVAEMDRLLAPLRLPAAGLHGLERRDVQGRFLREPAPGIPDGIRTALREFADARRGVLLEDKGGCAALHYRQAPECGEAARDLVRTIASAHDGFDILDGKMVVELRPAGADKGRAIAAFMEEAPFAGRRPVFVGDDVTDEDGFLAVNAMGGVSIRVAGADSRAAGRRTDGSRRAGSFARFRLADVAAVRSWLSATGSAAAGEGAASRKGTATCTASTSD